MLIGEAVPWTGAGAPVGLLSSRMMLMSWFRVRVQGTRPTKTQDSFKRL
jgi:hypothetical protein